MTTPLFCLVVGTFMPYLWAFIGAYLRSQQLGQLDNKNPRGQAAETTGAAARAYAAQQNAWEALPVFIVAVFISYLGNFDGIIAALGSVAWVLARLLHGYFYLTDQDRLRSLSFVVGIGCVIIMMTTAFIGV